MYLIRILRIYSHPPPPFHSIPSPFLPFPSLSIPFPLLSFLSLSFPSLPFVFQFPVCVLSVSTEKGIPTLVLIQSVEVIPLPLPLPLPLPSALCSLSSIPPPSPFRPLFPSHSLSGRSPGFPGLRHPFLAL